MLVVSLSALGPVAWYRGDLWWLIPSHGGPYGLALSGRWAAARRGRGWSHGYMHGRAAFASRWWSALLSVSLR